MVDDRAQVHTIEGFMAMFFILIATGFVVTGISVTPTSSGTAAQEVELQNEKYGDSIMEQATENGMMKEALLNWNNKTRRWNGSNDDVIGIFYTGIWPEDSNEDIPLADLFNQTLVDKGIVHNIDIRCTGFEGRFLDNGNPSDNTVTSTSYVTLYKDDEIHKGEGDGKFIELGNTTTFPCEGLDTDSRIYDIVEVRLTLWRM